MIVHVQPGMGAQGTVLGLRLSVKAPPSLTRADAGGQYGSLWLERWVPFCSLSGP